MVLPLDILLGILMTAAVAFAFVAFVIHVVCKL